MSKKEETIEIRPLSAKDIFPMVKIIRKIGLNDFGKCFEPEEINAITATFSGGTEEELARMVGMNVVLKIVDVILEHLPAVGEEVFVFIASLTGKTKTEVEDLPMDLFFNLVVDVLKREEFVGFMKAVSRLVK
nr:MAG TPA: hypothetical protein [Caudoviricetes sp.]